MTLQHGMTRGGRSMVGCVNGGWNLWSLTRLEFRFIMRKCEIENYASMLCATWSRIRMTFITCIITK